MDDDLLREWVEEFLRYLERRNYSPRTIESYDKDLKLFVRWVLEQDWHSMADFTTANLEKYQQYLTFRPTLHQFYSQPRSLTVGSRNRLIAAVKSFFRYLHRSGKLLGNPASALEMSRMVKALPKDVLTVAEMRRLLHLIPRENPSQLRDQAALELLYASGIRCFEFLAIDIPDVRLQEGLLRVMGKGQKERVVPIGQAAKEALTEYLQNGRPHLVKGSHPSVFVSATHGGRISASEMGRNLKHWVNQAGIRKKVSFHTFRHTCATHLLQGGADLRSIQVLLGHTALSTTGIYLRMDTRHLAETLKRCHPRSQKLAPPTDEE